jgi:hypothetical protein
MLIVPEQYAGQLMKCPLCTGTFTAPALPAPAAAGARAAAPAAATEAYTSSAPLAAPPAPADDIFRLAPAPPGPQEETPPHSSGAFDLPKSEAAVEPSPPPPVPPLAGYGRTFTIWISPRIVPWIGPVGLGVSFLLSFLVTWVKAFPKDSKMEELSAWGLAISGRGNLLIMAYVFLLTLAVLLAVASVVIPRLSIQLPAGIQQIMPWRSGIVGGLTILAFVFLLLQIMVGFGEEVLSSEGVPQSLRTVWLRLAFLVNLVAAVGTALEFWLAMRKARPLPRIDISW